MAPRMTMPDSGVKVRLYNSGQGDCMLLAFRGHDDKPRYMLIDCGIHHFFTPDRAERMRKVSKDIMESTGNNLHVVVVTHEHSDHLWGFKYGRKYFDKITIHDLWMPWTEDEHNSTAKKLKEIFTMRLSILTKAFKLFESSGQPFNKRLTMLPDFEPAQLGANGGNADQLKYLKDRSERKLTTSEDYLNPQDIVTMKDVGGVRFYVLGPPMKAEWIKILEEESELYPQSGFAGAASSFESAVLATSYNNNEDSAFDGQKGPFDDKYGLRVEDVKSDEFFIKHYGFEDSDDHGERWRRIDYDWLKTAEYLALSINKWTNNTSLVLAVELCDVNPSKVLLFAADAQVGNWLSWQELSWSENDSDITNVNDLLKRTVLYKVGHHGSHNATLSHKGLERMVSSELVSMIPVNSKWAKDKCDWVHPDDDVLEKLKVKSKGRVIRSDEIPMGNVYHKMPEVACSSEWEKFLENLEWDEDDGLWIQFTITSNE